MQTVGLHHVHFEPLPACRPNATCNLHSSETNITLYIQAVHSPTWPHSTSLAGRRPGRKPRFSTRSATSSCESQTWFATFRVGNLVANLLDLSRHVEIDLAGSRQVRWVRLGFRPARAMECRNDTTQRTQRTQRTCPRRLCYLF